MLPFTSITGSSNLFREVRINLIAKEKDDAKTFTLESVSGDVDISFDARD